jgi:hypothetical protein
MPASGFTAPAERVPCQTCANAEPVTRSDRPTGCDSGAARPSFLLILLRALGAWNV